MKTRIPIGISMNFRKGEQSYVFDLGGNYADAIYEAGGIPFSIPCFNDADILNQYLDRVGFLIFVGGHDYPPEIYNEPRHEKVETMDERRAEFDLLLFRLAFERKIPIVGICAGMQLINISMGGKLIQHLDNFEFHQPENYHPVTIKSSKWLSKIFPSDTIVVNSLHHQGVKLEYLGKNLNAVASATDGLIECVEYDGEQLCLGVQWHPERVSPSYLKASSFLGKEGAKKALSEHTSRFFSFIVEHANEYLQNKK